MCFVHAAGCSAATRTLHDACCVSRMFTHAARCTLYDARCTMHAARCMLHVSCRATTSTVRGAWCTVRYMLPFPCFPFHVACCTLHVACCMLHVATLRWMYGELHDWRYPNEPKLYTIHQRQGGYANKATHLHQDWAHPGRICTGTRRTVWQDHDDRCVRVAAAVLRTPHAVRAIPTAVGLAPPTSAPGLGSPLPHLPQEWVRHCHTCTGDWGRPLPHLRRDWARHSHICAGTRPVPDDAEADRRAADPQANPVHCRVFHALKGPWYSAATVRSDGIMPKCMSALVCFELCLFVCLFARAYRFISLRAWFAGGARYVR
jgi:hypothetical protein